MTGEAEPAPTEESGAKVGTSAGFPDFCDGIVRNAGGTSSYCTLSQEKKKVTALVCEAKEEM